MQPPKLPPTPPKDRWGDEDDDEGDSHPRNYFYLTNSQIEVIEDMYSSIGNSDPVYGVNDKEEIKKVTEQYKSIPKLRQLAYIFENSGVGAGLKFFLTLPDSVKESLWYSWDGHGLNVEQDCKKFGLNYDLNLDEDDVDMGDAGMASPATGGDIGSMGAGAGPTGGGKYSPGTAPSMPESANYKGKDIMENVDKDVAAMLASLKKYDMLVESVAPVIGMVTLGEKKGDLPPWLKDKEEKKDEPEAKDDAKEEDKEKVDESDDSEPYGYKKQYKKDEEEADTTRKTAKALNKEADKEKKDEVKEGADQEVLDWMKRFSKLGDMKGY
jgi:hypothetical protein